MMIHAAPDPLSRLGLPEMPRPSAQVRERPLYLRVVVTTACPMSCGFCHFEGDPTGPSRQGLPGPTLDRLLQLAVGQGVRKVKFLGGEPLARADLPERIRAVRRLSDDLDLSLITSGAAKPDILAACFDAGLSRANLSIHGWTEDAFARRAPSDPKQSRRLFEWRQRSLELLLRLGHFLKLNYVYDGPEVEADLAQFLQDMAGLPVVINLLNDLNQMDITPQVLAQALVRLRGPWLNAEIVPDPLSLDTTLLTWADGLRVELKTSELGSIAPWGACSTCSNRQRCREGIYALRLTHLGALQLCMDRPDLSLPLSDSLALGDEATESAWTQFVNRALAGRSLLDALHTLSV